MAPIRLRARTLASLLLVGLVAGCAVPPNPVPPVEPFVKMDESQLAPGRVPDHLRERPREVVRVRFARVDSAALARALSARAGRPVSVRLFDDVAVSLTTESVTRKDGRFDAWTGRPAAKIYGRGHITFAPPTAFGVIQSDTRVFEILPVYDDVVRITEYDQARYPKEGRPIPKRERAAPKEPPAAPPARPDTAERAQLKVLVLLPLPSYAFICSGNFFPFGNLLPLVANAFEDNLNDVFAGLEPTGVTATVVVECLSRTPAGGDLIADLHWVDSDATVAALRDRHQADLVSLIIPSGDFCGRGYENYPVEAGDAPLGFSVVKASCALGNFSFAHELGHNIGMRHDRAADDAFASETCNYGHIFPVRALGFDLTVRSVMAYDDACDGCPRIGVYSSPRTVNLLGIITVGPMGVPCDAPADDKGRFTRANNRQQLIDAAPVVAGFR
ncbi:MAG TPA: zinc-dependent metalloprotease family protein [Methylomirabilota bacterium]|nr:zinc-dependent metalloprotease family protein [Methylomirabilota bacterium]